MTTSYPGAIDTLSNPTPSDPLNSATVPHAAQHANANDAIEAIETELGTTPSGPYATVAARFTQLESVIDDRVPGEAGSNAPTGTLPNGYVWIDTSSNAIKVWNGSAWVDPSNAGSGQGGLPWAVVTGGTVTEYTHPTHGVMEVHTFIGNGTLVGVSAGLAEVLVCGGGSGSSTQGNTGQGGGGGVRWGMFTIPTGNVPVTVGQGTAAVTGGAWSTQGGTTSLGTVLAVAGGGEAFGSSGSAMSRDGNGGGSGSGGLVLYGAGGVTMNGGGAGGKVQGTNAYDGVTHPISGTAIEYGRGGVTGGPQPIANRGGGGVAGAGTAGVVIVAVKKP